MAQGSPDHPTALLGRLVLDGRGERLGHLASVYTDTHTDTVSFAGVAMIRRGRRRIVFVPLAGARVTAESITLCCGKQLARRAPSVQVGHLLPAAAEPALFTHYDLPYTPTAGGTRRLVPAQ